MTWRVYVVEWRQCSIVLWITIQRCCAHQTKLAVVAIDGVATCVGHFRCCSVFEIALDLMWVRMGDGVRMERRWSAHRALTYLLL
jgi:hypothetical protein